MRCVAAGVVWMAVAGLGILLSHDSSRVPPPTRRAIRIINQSRARANERRPRQRTTTVARARTVMMRRDASPDASWRGAVAALVEDADAFRRAVSFEHTANGNVGRGLVRAPRVALDLRAACAYAVVMFTFNWFLRTVVVKPLASALMGFGDGFPGDYARSRSREDGKVRAERARGGDVRCVQLLRRANRAETNVVLAVVVVVDRGSEKDARGGHAFDIYYRRLRRAIRRRPVNVLLEHKRKDFWEMQLHHVATIIVIWISYAHGWTRVGAVIMLVLDPATFRCTTAKCFKYAGYYAQTRYKVPIHRRRLLRSIPRHILYHASRHVPVRRVERARRGSTVL